MVDTVRTRAELLNTIFADGQAAGAITPQDMRDFIVSTYGTTGWGDYVDTEYTTGVPQAITLDLSRQFRTTLGRNGNKNFLWIGSLVFTIPSAI